MSEEQSNQASNTECGMCGRDGGVIAECTLCHGSTRFNQERHFTLSEERQGKNPDANKERYGLHGDVNPRIVVLPGGFDPSQGKG